MFWVGNVLLPAHTTSRRCGKDTAAPGAAVPFVGIVQEPRGNQAFVVSKVTILGDSEEERRGGKLRSKVRS